MKKSLIVIALVLGFSTSAFAVPPSFTPASDSKVITLNATVQQRAACALSATEVDFNIVDPTVATDGTTTVTINCSANIRKNGNATIYAFSSDLLAASGGASIPAASVLGSNNAGTSWMHLNPGAGGPFSGTGNVALGYYNAAQGLNDVAVDTTLALRIAPVPTAVPDQYTGTVTILFQVQ